MSASSRRPLVDGKHHISNHIVQKEMLLSIEGKKPAKEAAAKKSTARSQRKSA
jgi:hypothetical protein